MSVHPFRFLSRFVVIFFFVYFTPLRLLCLYRICLYVLCTLFYWFFFVCGELVMKKRKNKMKMKKKSLDISVNLWMCPFYFFFIFCSLSLSISFNVIYILLFTIIIRLYNRSIYTIHNEYNQMGFVKLLYIIDLLFLKNRARTATIPSFFYPFDVTLYVHCTENMQCTTMWK